jgi:inositol-1,4,5-trisphosphate 5-phosphatase
MNNSAIGNKYDKLSIFMLTWNVSHLQIDKEFVNLSKIFTNNILYQNKSNPDIIFITLQETNIPSDTEDEASKNSIIAKWTEEFNKCIDSFFAGSVYIPIKVLDYEGIYFICFAKYEFKLILTPIFVQMDKAGFEGKFINIVFNFNNYSIALSSVNFIGGGESGKRKVRFDSLKHVLNNLVNLGDNIIINFKKVDYWFIFGDTNFRTELNYNSAINSIQQNDLENLLSNDEFNKYKGNDIELNSIREGTILFKPTYKLEKGTFYYADNQHDGNVPSYCDRILFGNKNGIKLNMYNSIDEITYSEHKPVVGVFEIFFKK